MEIKIFAMSDYEWVAARTSFSALRFYMKQTGLKKADLEDSDYPAEVCGSEMDRLKFLEDDGTDKTFRQKLAELVLANDQFPLLFAMTEY